MKKLNKKNLVVVLTTLILVGSLAGWQIAQAAAGDGTATINVDGGAQGAGVTVAQSTSHIFKAVLTIASSGITLGAISPTFRIPAGFTAPNGHAVATANDVNADGKWSVTMGGPGGCTVDSTPGSSTTVASGQTITVDITADCAASNTITLTYQGTSATTMIATQLVISTSDGGQAVVALASGSPTITVTGPTANITVASAKITSANTVLVTLNNPGFNITSVDFLKWHIDVGGGGSSPLTPTSAAVTSAGTPWTVTLTFSGTPFSDTATAYSAALGLYVDALGVTDTNGDTNVVVGHASSTVITDSQAPTLISAIFTDNALKVGETSLVTFTFSEPITGFTNADLTIVNGVLTAVTDLGAGTIWTATFTPTVSVEDATNMITVAMTGVADLAANAGVGTTNSSNYAIDTTAPSTPTTSPVAGTYIGTQNVTISSVGSDSIRFTTDGSTPSCSVGTLYSGVISVSLSEMINVIGCDTAGNTSSALFAYTINIISNGSGPLVSVTNTPAYIPPAIIKTPSVTLTITSTTPTPTPTPTATTTTTPTTNTNTYMTTIPVSYNFGSFTLRQGNKGNSVLDLQKFLNEKMKANLKLDGKLGKLTIALVKQWQKNHGLVADGIIGVKTKAAMNTEAKNN